MSSVIGSFRVRRRTIRLRNGRCWATQSANLCCLVMRFSCGETTIGSSRLTIVHPKGHSPSNDYAVIPGETLYYRPLFDTLAPMWRRFDTSLITTKVQFLKSVLLHRPLGVVRLAREVLTLFSRRSF